jgi:D-lactate dehydrogenase
VRVAIFSSKPYDSLWLAKANEQHHHELCFYEAHLNGDTAALAQGFDVVCAFVNDHLDRTTLEKLQASGVRLVALRCAGFNNVDLRCAAALKLTIARVPAYSPYSVAEHAVALILALNRHLHRAYARVREGNFSLQGLCGFDLRGRAIGVVGTGKIGVAFARILHGFGCQLWGYDPEPNEECRALGMHYVSLPELLAKSDIVSLHCPLNSATRHLIDAAALERMKPGAMLINTGRGALIDTAAVIQSLKSGKLGFLGIDVYEEEENLFFEDLSNEIIQDDVFMRLLTFPNVLVTAHQGFFTEEALHNIAETTLSNISAFATGNGTLHRVPLPAP